MSRFLIVIKGIVQGVGFRPFVYNLAQKLDCRGFVKNTSNGVVIEIESAESACFIESLRKDIPPLAQIHEITITELPPKGYDNFSILESLDEGSFTHVSPDTSVCDDCLREMLDPGDRRHLYPFINCTNCGPRYTITQRVPYDRPNTTMSVFTMCPQCEAEYHDPSNRRFHAQPNACPRCGPRVELRIQDSGFRIQEGKEPIGQAIGLIKEGAILAVKGLGGFHLCCDAQNRQAVTTLRQRKRRRNKPFALMAPDIPSVKAFCEVSGCEELLLLDRRRPVVLLRKGKDQGLSGEIAPKNGCFGFMLPYTPLHYLLFYHPMVTDDSGHATLRIGTPCAIPPLGKVGRRGEAAPHFSALVMTSGNLSEEPIVIDNDEALAHLRGVADAFLFHDRNIFMRVDDSVLRAEDCMSSIASPSPAEGAGALFSGPSTSESRPATIFVRRSRGYVPESIELEGEGPDVLACGADLKNTFTITKDAHAIVSQHIGDMENLETVRFFEESLSNLKQVYRAEPKAVAHDLHPDYLSTRWALKYCEEFGIRSHAIQHHYAHIASVMAEHRLKDAVIGVAFDGTGYGADGNLWGGEFLVCDLNGFIRAAHFRYIPLPGGESAIRECWRTAVSLIAHAVREGCPPGTGGRSERLGTSGIVWETLEALGFIKRYGKTPLANVLNVLGNSQFSPLSTGAGRLFDAVSAMIGLCDRNTFEGEAAIALESILHAGPLQEPYPFELAGEGPFVVDFSLTVLRILNDLSKNVERSVVSARFHQTVVAVIGEVVRKVSARSGIRKVALSGGVFQNSYILENALSALSARGFQVYTHRKVPCNDGCISLGQAYILRERMRNSPHDP